MKPRNGKGRHQRPCDAIREMRPPKRQWVGAELNRRHHDFQSCALPTELSRHGPESTAPRAPWWARPERCPEAGATGLEPATSGVTGRRSKPTELRPREQLARLSHELGAIQAPPASRPGRQPHAASTPPTSAACASPWPAPQGRVHSRPWNLSAARSSADAVTQWAQQDLNLRPPACKAGALPLSYAPVLAR